MRVGESISRHVQCVLALSLVTTFFAPLASAVPVSNPFELRSISGSSQTKSQAAPAPAGWETVGFDDSAWTAARIVPAPASPIRPIPFGNPATAVQAQYIWHDPNGTSDGSNGVNEAFFRTHFSMPAVTGAALPFDAIVSIVADDDFEAWFNGTKIATEADFGTGNDRGPDYIYRYDVTNLIQQGADNVLAIHATDGSLNAPDDVGYEHLAYQIRVRTVPEPFGLALLLPAMLAIGRSVRRRVPE